MSGPSVIINPNITITLSNTGPQGIGVPPGGTTGQVLAKNSDADYDTVWQNSGSGGGGLVSAFFLT